MLPPFTIICVSYFSLEKIKAMYKTLPDNLPIVVVDNAQEDLLEFWCQEEPNIKYIRAEENLGFGKACNFGAKHANTDWLFFLNPDTLVAQNLADQFKSFLKQFQDVGIFAPLLVDSAGKKYYKKRSHLTRPRRNPKKITNTISTSIISGAAFWVKKDVFEKLNGFDEKIFMYFEDDDFFERANAQGYTSYLTPTIEIFHAGNNSSPESANLDNKKAYYWGWSECYVLRKHKKHFQIYRMLLELALRKVFLSPLRSRRKEKYRQRFKGFYDCFRRYDPD